MSLLLMMIACGGKEDSGVDPVLGTVTAERDGETADAEAQSAFGYNRDGRAVIYLSPNPDTTCADVGTYLSGPDAEWDPSVVNAAGKCSVFFQVTYEGAEVSYSDDPVNALIALNCAMNEGSWVLEQRDDYGYYYSGPWWQGSPTTAAEGGAGYAMTLSGGEGDDFQFSLDASSYSGNFIYESMEDAPASGAVAGTGTATWCDDIGLSVFF